MNTEYNFSNAQQGKFYHPNATFHFPIYLELDVDEFIVQLAENQGIEPQVLINILLRNNINLIHTLQPEVQKNKRTQSDN